MASQRWFSFLSNLLVAPALLCVACEKPPVATVPDPPAASFERVKDCAAQAERVLAGVNADEPGHVAMTNHWNQRLGRCFVLLDITTRENGAYTTETRLLDAFERRPFVVRAQRVGREAKDSLFMCTLEPLNAKKSSESSPLQCIQAIDLYMEESIEPLGSKKLAPPVPNS